MTNPKTIAVLVTALAIPSVAAAHNAKHDERNRLVVYGCQDGSVEYFTSTLTYNGTQKIPSKIETRVDEHDRHFNARLDLFGPEGLVLQVKDDLSGATQTYVCKYSSPKTTCEGPEGTTPLSALMTKHYRSFETLCQALRGSVNNLPFLNQMCIPNPFIGHPQADWGAYETGAGTNPLKDIKRTR